MTKLDKEIQEGLYDIGTSDKVKGLLHMAVDKLLDPKKSKGKRKVIVCPKCGRRIFANMMRTHKISCGDDRQIPLQIKGYDPKKALKVGDDVFHPHYGDGYIKKIYPHGYGDTGKPEADVSFNAGEVSVSMARLTRVYDPKKTDIYIITDSRGNKHKATYAQWLKWMKEQKRPYDLSKKSIKELHTEMEKIRTQTHKANKWLHKNKRYVALQNEYARRLGLRTYDPKPSALPPKRWYEAMVRGIKKSSDVRNPYAIVKSIWARLSSSKRSEIHSREAKGERFKYDLPLPKDLATRGIGTVRMVKPFKLAEVQVNLSVKDYLSARASGLFNRMKRHDGTTALVARCKARPSTSDKNVNLFVDKVK